MVSCGTPGYTNQADKNSYIITLVTITMLLQLYCSILRILTYVMREAYSKLCQIFTMMRHTENPDIV